MGGVSLRAWRAPVRLTASGGPWAVAALRLFALIAVLIAGAGEALAESPGCAAFSGSYNQDGPGGSQTHNTYNALFFAGDRLNVNVISLGPGGTNYSLIGQVAGASGATSSGSYPVTTTGADTIELDIAVFFQSG